MVLVVFSNLLFPIRQKENNNDRPKIRHFVQIENVYLDRVWKRLLLEENGQRIQLQHAVLYPNPYRSLFFFGRHTRHFARRKGSLRDAISRERKELQQHGSRH